MPKIEWSLSGTELTALGYSFSRWKRCAAGECGKRILMAWTPRQALMPMVEVERPVTAPEGRWFQPHFIDCPASRKFKKPRKKRDKRNE